MARDDDYQLIKDLARTEEAGSLAKERAVLLLWFLRNSVGIDDLDAYDFVCDGDRDKGVDGLFLEQAPGDEDYETLVVYQSKFTERPSAVKPNDIKNLVATANHFRDGASISALRLAKIEPRLRALIEEFELEAKAKAGGIATGKLRLRLVLVTTGYLSADAQLEVNAANNAQYPGYLTVHDIDRLGPLARAVTSPKLLQKTIAVHVHKSSVLTVATGPNQRVAILPVPAAEIVKWDGIQDRSLFELNVRRQLRPNKVSAQLDGALRRAPDHRDFLAYHNGLTVVCDSFSSTSAITRIVNPSVVNGAQSVVAFARAEAEGVLTPQLMVFVKLVEVAGRPQLAKEVSRRSNTQNPVNPRMLMSHSGPQLRLAAEFAALYPMIAYETRPDFSNPPKQKWIIPNDAAAQLLCTVFNAMPWLAVKRTALFESENHALIFNELVSASHIVVADLVGQAVDKEKGEYPDAYRSSWRLTRIVAGYLVGQILRASNDGALTGILSAPASAAVDMVATLATLRRTARVAAVTLKIRRVQLIGAAEADDYNREFKNETTLRALGKEAQKNYLLATSLGGTA